MKLPRIIIITGPTASGKTALSLKLAKKFNGEIISADSRQIYRGMDIGTAKASKKELKSVRHHLIDIRNPDQSYSLAEFKRDAIQAARDIISKGKVPFLVGGTALYIWAITDNPQIPEVKPNLKLRKLLENQLKRRGVHYLYKKLIFKDPEAAYIIDPKNPRRIIRALEIMEALNKPFSQTRNKGPKLFDFLLLGMTIPARELKSNIEKRAQLMIKKGLVNEIRSLTKKYPASLSLGEAGDRENLSSMDAIGYREIIRHLKEESAPDQALEEINKNTRRFASRQMTWFKKLPVTWIKNQKDAENKIKAFLAKAG